MTRSKLLAVSVYLGAVLIGAAAGIAADRTLIRDTLVPRSQDPRQVRDQFFDALGLTDAQRASWDSISVQGRRADSVLRAPYRALQESLLAPARPKQDSLRAKLDSMWKARDDRYRALLTPEQLKLFADWQARRQKQNNDRR